MGRFSRLPFAYFLYEFYKSSFDLETANSYTMQAIPINRLIHPQLERKTSMASTAVRIRKLIQDNLEVDGQPIALPDDLNISLTEAGVSSVDILAFAKLVAEEFNMEFSPQDCVDVKTVQELVSRLDAAA
ncbi:MAG: acyl carrier protein [Gemmatimonadetes bacterium]|nr:acyl carrier protein [Gemmatimonadota bacterium]